jgi:hypothetical protein
VGTTQISTSDVISGYPGIPSSLDKQKLKVSELSQTVTIRIFLYQPGVLASIEL